MGTPATFIRLFGCNLKCSFCDEPKHTNADLITKLDEVRIGDLCTHERVIITGGEPSLHNINPLINYLQEGGHLVAVETNGFKYYNLSEADWITLAPKGFERPKGMWSEVKLLLSLENAEQIVHEIEYWKGITPHVYVQPINGVNSISQENLKLAIMYAMKYDVGLSPQLHKILGVE